MPDPSLEDVRRIIAEVREGNGCITVEDRATTPESVLRALQKTRKQLGDTMKSLVDDIHAKDTRPIYELIQHAKHRSYSTAIANGEEPFLRFLVFKDQICVDSNENVFSESDIRNICSVEGSATKYSTEYIDGVTIGLKSVFKIARKVHIQSGLTSFALSHTLEDDGEGLGMITPYDEDARKLDSDVRTRITLTLLDSIDIGEPVAELLGIPDSFIMFLGPIRRLYVRISRPNNELTIREYSKRDIEENGLCMTFTTNGMRENEKATSAQKYYTVKKQFCLPFFRATIVLAFPVDEHDEPIIQQQYIYGFLPLRRIGLNFLIYVDCMDRPNREDEVPSWRYRDVMDGATAAFLGVAEIFVDAMALFCKLPSLKYKWMRYFPEDSSIDGRWKILWTFIRERLQRTPLLEPWSGNGLYKPLEIERLPPEFVDKDGNPLEPNLDGAQVYLSPNYAENDFRMLERLGTTTLQWSKVIDRLDVDLRKADASRWRSMRNTTEWRTQVCKLLLNAFATKSPDMLSQQDRLRALALIPLHDGTWVSSTSLLNVYFPQTLGISIPLDLGLDLVHPIVVETASWIDLLSILGVMRCSSETVIGLIHRRYYTNGFNIFNAVAHIKYLYWFLPTDVSKLAPQIRLADQDGFLVEKDQYLYFPGDEDDFSPSKLFKEDAQHPGHPVNYLHADYLKVVDAGVTNNGRRSWTKWLEEVAGVRRLPVLCAKDNELSTEFQYIINHRSDRLLGILKQGWAEYHLTINPQVKRKLLNSYVLLENGQRKMLCTTSLPFPKLKQIATELAIADEYPFLAMYETLRDEDKTDWSFLKSVPIDIEEDHMPFYMFALSAFIEVNPTIVNLAAVGRLIRIYQNIQSRSNEGPSTIRRSFELPMIWIKRSTRIGSNWLSSQDCVWEGPQWLKSKQCLKSRTYLPLESLFKSTLKIPDASENNVIDDLLILRTHTENEKASRHRSLAQNPSASVGDKSTYGTVGTPYQVTSLEFPDGTTGIGQSIAHMDAYKKRSHEELRLEDYNAGRKPSPTTTVSIFQSNAFNGLETHNIAEEAQKRYDYLWQKQSLPTDNRDLKSRTALCFTFEGSNLVYIPRENAWFPPSRCVWAKSHVNIAGKASIADVYPSLKTFFTSVLNVAEPTVSMYREALQSGAQGNASTAEIKEIMTSICSLDFKGDISGLVYAKILPIKLANGRYSLASASGWEVTDFAIVETVAHRDAFESKIAALDFSIEDVRDLRPLLLAMGLKPRFSTQVVKEVTVAGESSEDYEMTRNLQDKSHALVRCAIHFASLDKRQAAASLYRKFKRASVYVSDDIRRSWQMTQNGRFIESGSTRANFHLEEIDGTLRFHLPKDEVEREVCFEFDMPRRLGAFLGITDPEAFAIIGGVLRKHNLVVVNKILDSAGVGQVDRDFAASDEELRTPQNKVDIETPVEADINEFDFSSSIEAIIDDGASLPQAVPPPATPLAPISDQEQQSVDDTSKVGDVGEVSAPRLSTDDQQLDAQQMAYKNVLEHVTDVARQRVLSGVLETTGTPVQGSVITEALSSDIVQSMFDTTTEEGRYRLGAAGELYMFEYLQGLDLPGFGIDNWKSEHRDKVEIHKDYHSIQGYYGDWAIADIEYHDQSGKLTQFLIQKGLLAQSLWAKERPTYHFEVKTTAKSYWQTVFYMSSKQEEHVRGMRIERGETASNIYVICRIFNLGRGDETGVHIYLDPETWRRNQELDFRLSNYGWIVTPLSHPYMPIWNGSVTSPPAPSMRATSADERTGGIGSNHARKASVFSRSSETGFPSTSSPLSNDRVPDRVISAESLPTPLSSTGTTKPLPIRSQGQSGPSSAENAAHRPNIPNSNTLATNVSAAASPPTTTVPRGGSYSSPTIYTNATASIVVPTNGSSINVANTAASNGPPTDKSSSSAFKSFESLKANLPTGGVSGTSAGSTSRMDIDTTVETSAPPLNSTRSTAPSVSASSGPRTFSSAKETSKPSPPGFSFATSAPPSSSSTHGFSSFSADTSRSFGSNASSSTAGGLFGTTRPSAAAGGLFGTNPPSSSTADRPSGGSVERTSSSSSATSGLFGTTRPSPAAGPLFGTNPPSSSAAGGLFGTRPAFSSSAIGPFSANSSSSAAGGLFGMNAPSSSATGGLFGRNPLSSSAAGGLFSTNPPSSSAAGRAFGTTQPSSSTAGGLFGMNPTASAADRPFGGLFNSNPPASLSGEYIFNTFFNRNPPTSSTADTPFGGLFNSNSPSYSATSGPFGTNPRASTTDRPFGSNTSSPNAGGLFGTSPSFPPTTSG